MGGRCLCEHHQTAHSLPSLHPCPCPLLPLLLLLLSLPLPLQVTDSLKALEGSTGADGAALKALLDKAVGDSAYVEERGSRLPGFRYLSAAEANKIVALRRKQVRTSSSSSSRDREGGQV